jgi:hypothetical protein
MWALKVTGATKFTSHTCSAEDFEKKLKGTKTICYTDSVVFELVIYLDALKWKNSNYCLTKLKTLSLQDFSGADLL